MGAQPLPFNTAKLSLTVMGEALPVIAMTGTEALSSVFRFKIEAIIDRCFDMSGCIQSPAL
jgi:hypothetical protein